MSQPWEGTLTIIVLVKFLLKDLHEIWLFFALQVDFIEIKLSQVQILRKYHSLFKCYDYLFTSHWQHLFLVQKRT